MYCPCGQKAAGQRVRSCALSSVYAVLFFALSASAGNTAGTAIPEENPSSVPEWLTVSGDTLYFVADDGLHGRELWQCDTQGQCSLAADIVSGPDGLNPEKLIDAHGWLYFQTS